MKRKKSAWLGRLLAAGAAAGLVMLSGCAGSGAKREAAAPLTAETREKALESYDYVYNTIKQTHWDTELVGAKWDEAHARLRPKVQDATTMVEARGATEEMIASLGQSHFGLIPADAYADVVGEDSETDAEAGTGDAGLQVRVVDGRAYVVSVVPDSTGARAGVKPGWELEQVRGKDLAERLRVVAEEFEGQIKQGAMLSLAAEGALSGPVGSTVQVRFRDENGKRATRKLELAEPAGTPAKFGNLPTMYVRRDARRLESGVGYMSLSLFFDPAAVMPWYQEQIASMQNAPGIILDLRGNRGGIGGMAMGMGARLVTQANQKLGDMITRQTTIKFVLNPQAGSYAGRVAVLVDELSMSTSEILAGGLQAIGRARVFGTRTPGMALPSRIERLASGDGFQYATANYISADGQVLEGHGVVPDETVPPDPALLSQGRDPVIEAAEQWILGQNRPGT
ncbi:MAG: S41 family peptidase [Planctomycetota bacterium]|nr:S41 family peptidase [Planctomycetota bacterium]